MSDNSEDWGPYFDILDKIEDEREASVEQAKAEEDLAMYEREDEYSGFNDDLAEHQQLQEDYRHAEELATEVLLILDSMDKRDRMFISRDGIAALRFLTGIPRATT